MRLGANVEVFSYLYALATIGMTFAGLSVLTMILRQMLGGQMTKFDSFVTRTWVQLGFMVTFGSILAPLVALFETPKPIAWRVSSSAMAVVLGCWTLTFPRRRHAANPTHLPMPVMAFVIAMTLTALAFATNATFAPVERLPAVYAAAVTAILFGAGMLFLFTFVHWYETLISHQQPKS